MLTCISEGKLPIPYLKIPSRSRKNQYIIPIDEFWKYSYRIKKSCLVSYIIARQIIAKKKNLKLNLNLLHIEN